MSTDKQNLVIQHKDLKSYCIASDRNLESSKTEEKNLCIYNLFLVLNVCVCTIVDLRLFMRLVKSVC